MSDEPTLSAGPSFGFTFLYYFCGTALVTTLLAVKILDMGLDTGLPSQYGLLFGAVGGPMGALANRSTTLELPISSRKTFKRELDATLVEMGYTENTAADLDGVLVYQRSFIRQLFSGRIYVLMDEKQAHISSRVLHIRDIKKRLETSGIR